MQHRITTVKAIIDNGQLIGAQGMDVSLGGLTDIIADIKLGETGYLMLIEDSGSVLVDVKHPDYRFKNLADLEGGKIRRLS